MSIITHRFKLESKGTPDGKREDTKQTFIEREFSSSFLLGVQKGGFFIAETRLAVVSIINESMNSAEKMNALLYEFGEYIVGRMGIPYKSKKVFVHTIVIDAPQEIINALTGKLGMIEGISAKTLFSKY